jgi:hypothetical protein
MAHKFRLYHINTPKEKTMVNFIFTEHMPDCFKCYLVDYDVEAIMPLHLATTKSTIKSPKSLAPLNKPMVGVVEEINENIIISMAYVDKESDEYKEFDTTNDQTKRMVSIVKKYATMNKMNYVEYWEETIYPLDMNRPDDTSLFDHIFDSIDLLDAQLGMMLQALAMKRTVMPTKFKMISHSGITSVKQSIDMALDASGLRGKISIVMDSPPHFIISSIDDTTDESHHTIFKEKLIEIAKEYDIMIE